MAHCFLPIVILFLPFSALPELLDGRQIATPMREGFITMATKSSSSKGKRKVHKVMKEQKQGNLKSSTGKKVTSRKQAVAIALSEARRSGAKIPKKKS